MYNLTWIDTSKSILYRSSNSKFGSIDCYNGVCAALNHKYQLYVWGSDHYGRLGYNSLGKRYLNSIPKRVKHLPPIEIFGYFSFITNKYHHFLILSCIL